MLSKENLQSFITDSPFSFRNPIFFSVPREGNLREANLVSSKRKLFTDQEETLRVKARCQT